MLKHCKSLRLERDDPVVRVVESRSVGRRGGRGRGGEVGECGQCGGAHSVVRVYRDSSSGDYRSVRLGQGATAHTVLLETLRR